MTHKEKAVSLVELAIRNDHSPDWELIIHHIIEAAKEEVRAELHKAGVFNK